MPPKLPYNGMIYYANLWNAIYLRCVSDEASRDDKDRKVEDNETTDSSLHDLIESYEAEGGDPVSPGTKTKVCV
jgi:hypothetical protein